MNLKLRKCFNWADVFAYFVLFFIIFVTLSSIFLVIRSIYIDWKTDDNYEEVQKYVSNFQSWAWANDISYSDIRRSICKNPKVNNLVSSDRYIDKETCLNRTKVLLNCNPETKKVPFWDETPTFVPSPYNPLTYENTLSLALSVKSSDEADKLVTQCQSLINKKETAPTNLLVEQVSTEQNPSTLSQ